MLGEWYRKAQERAGVCKEEEKRAGKSMTKKNQKIGDSHLNLRHPIRFSG